MSRLPDLEGLAIFAKVVEVRSFTSAAEDLRLSKATSRVEARLRTRLFNRTSRRLVLTDAGRELAGRASHILAEGEAAESGALAQATTPRGVVRLTAPISFGVQHIAPLVPEFLAAYPEISIDLQLSDARTDIIGEHFDAAIRIAESPGAGLVARRLCDMARHLVGAPAYLREHGRPRRPQDLAGHRCLTYAYIEPAPETWRFKHKNGKSVSLRPSGPLRVNNGDAMLPALIAGTGLGILPEFILRDALGAGQLERLLPDWSLASGGVYWVTPVLKPRPKRVEVLGEFLARKLSRR
jgi:DNA-binding transcriptional LysR family regulator